MNNEPVAWMLADKEAEHIRSIMAVQHDFVPEGCVEIALYTHPVKELNDGGEPVKNATYWKRQYNLMATQNDNLKSGLYHANEQIKYLESHSAELTDEEWVATYMTWCLTSNDPLVLKRAILKKASEK